MQTPVESPPNGLGLLQKLVKQFSMPQDGNTTLGVKNTYARPETSRIMSYATSPHSDTQLRLTKLFGLLGWVMHDCVARVSTCMRCIAGTFVIACGCGYFDDRNSQKLVIGMQVDVLYQGDKQEQKSDSSGAREPSALPRTRLGG